MQRSWRIGLLILVFGLLVTSFVFVMATRSAEAATGTPAVTVTATPSANKLIVSGVYSDPAGVCSVSNQTVTIVVRANDAGGAILKNYTTTTDANGLYSEITPGGALGAGTYYVEVTVAGTLAGGYGGTDMCPSVSNNTTAVIP